MASFRRSASKLRRASVASSSARLSGSAMALRASCAAERRKRGSSGTPRDARSSLPCGITTVCPACTAPATSASGYKGISTRGFSETASRLHSLASSTTTDRPRRSPLSVSECFSRQAATNARASSRESARIGNATGGPPSCPMTLLASSSRPPITRSADNAGAVAPLQAAHQRSSAWQAPGSLPTSGDSHMWTAGARSSQVSRSSAS